MKLTLTIETGNDAMRNHIDLAYALDVVATRLRSGGEQVPPLMGALIRDTNGNTVGRWEIETD